MTLIRLRTAAVVALVLPQSKRVSGANGNYAARRHAAAANAASEPPLRVNFALFVDTKIVWEKRPHFHPPAPVPPAVLETSPFLFADLLGVGNNILQL